MFKTETHMHTAPVSSCSRIGPREMVKRHKDAGYDTVFVSDHFAKFHFDKLGENLTWEEKVNRFFQAYDEARAAGEEYGINVLLSAELSLAGNHYLMYGINKEVMMARPDIFDITVEEFSAYARANGITVVQAHPLRDGKCVPKPELVDGFEVINSNPRHENFDDQVWEIARQYNLPVSAGSDAHRDEDIGGAAMLSENEIKTVEDYLELLKSGKAKLMKWGKIV